MPRMSRVDKTLLFTITPLFVIVFTLHVTEAARTGLAQAPFFAAPAAESGGYPTVAGPRLEHGVDRSGLRVGDRLIRAGDNDLAGAGYLGFDALVVEAAGADATTTLVYERDGARHETQLDLVPYPHPFMRVPFLLSFALMSLIVLLRNPGDRQARRVFLAGMLFAICQLHFFGGSRWQSYASLVIFNFGSGIGLWALLRWMLEFPEEVPKDKRLPGWIAWLGGIFVLTRLNYVFGGPVPTEQVPWVVLASDGFFSILILGILTWNAVHATAIGRRRSKWLLLGGYLTVIAMLLTLVPSFIDIEGIEFFDSLPYGMLLGAVFPLTMLVAILRYDLFDIDRILRSTVAYSLALAAGLVMLVSAAPTVTTVLTRTTGLAERTTLGLLAAALVVIFAPLGRLVSHRFERAFTPERHRREVGFQKLFVDLADCPSEREILDLLSNRIEGLFEPEFSVMLVRTGDQFRVADGETAQIGPWSVRGRLARGLEAHPYPLAMDDRTLQPRLARLDSKERGSVEAEGIRVIVPIRRGKTLVALLCIGASRSGDIYTSTDLTLLAGAAEKASAELLRREDSEELVRERAHSAELATLKEEADLANLAKSRFLAAASHDLRQPLHALGLFVDHLGAQVTDPKSSDLVAKIRDSTGTLRDMFTALLDLSRLDAGAVTPKLEDIDVAALFGRLHSDLADEAQAKGLQFRVSCGTERVHSDPVLLTRILQNLLFNAVRYTERGEVELEAEAAAGSVALSVRDTGPGIPENKQREVFQEFVQLGPSSDERDGIGLGLSIVERLARVLDHPLTLESRLGQGSCFTLRLPAARAAATLRTPQYSLPNRDVADSLIVVIDDDLAILDATRTTLASWGCRVIVATSAEEAIAGIGRRGEPDVVLADYSLQDGETGLQAIERIRSFVGRSVPAVVVTGETSDDVAARLSESGLLTLTKPVSPLSLRATLAELLRND